MYGTNIWETFTLYGLCTLKYLSAEGVEDN